MSNAQEEQVPQPLDPEYSDKQKRELGVSPTRALDRSKPRYAISLQFYNYVSELSKMHHCSFNEGLKRASLTWPGLSIHQRKLYDSKRLSAQPNPVERPLVNRALGGRRSSRYTLESNNPTPETSRLQAQLNERRPKNESPEPNRKFSRVSPASGRRIRNLTPPAVRRVRPIRQILQPGSVDKKKSAQLRKVGKTYRIPKTKHVKLQPVKKQATGISKLPKKKTIKRKGVASKAKQVAMVRRS